MDRVAGHRVARDVLDHDRRGRIAADAELEHRAGVRERVSKHAGVDLERDGLLAAAVEDAGQLPVPAQATRGPRARGLTRLDGKRCRWAVATTGDGSGRARAASRPCAALGLRAKIGFMSAAAQLMLMVGGMHLLGLVCAAVLMLPALRDNPEFPPRPDGGSDGGWGRGPDLPPKAPEGPRGGIPLPDAEQSRSVCAITGGSPSAFPAARAAPGPGARARRRSASH